MSVSLAVLLGLGDRQGLERECVNFIAHQAAQRGINQAVTCQWHLSDEGITHHGRLKMHPVITAYGGSGSGQAGFNEGLDVRWIHVADQKFVE